MSETDMVQVPGELSATHTPRIARSGEDLRAGQSVAWIEPKDGQWWVCQSYDPDEGWDWTGTEIILSDPEPPVPSLPTTPGSVPEPKVTLTDEELEALHLADLLCDGVYDCALCKKVIPTVESIVAHRVAEALRDAADYAELVAADGERRMNEGHGPWDDAPQGLTALLSCGDLDEKATVVGSMLAHWLRDRANSYDPTGGTDDE